MVVKRLDIIDSRGGHLQLGPHLQPRFGDSPDVIESSNMRTPLPSSI